ncbi:MAG: LuxR C-terminal-related transcriptional regulator [Candidatus Limnocylindrales bacterium]
MPATFTSARFVGREDAFTRLASVLQGAAVGEAGTLLVEGTAGVGVSRFVDEAVRRVGALREPMLVVRGGAYGSGTDGPYAQLIRALRPVLAALSDEDLDTVLGSTRDEILRLFPELTSRIGLADRDRVRLTTIAERRQARLLEGILGTIGRLGERQPVLLVMEDLHRADHGTRTLFGFLARIARTQRLAIVGTYQGDAIRRQDPWAADLDVLASAPRSPSRLSLGPLRRDELARLIESIEGERPSASVLVVVVERSGGRPLVAEELLAARRELPSVSLTSSFEDLVLARVAVRSLECRRVLRLLAMADRPLPIGELAAVAAAFEAAAPNAPPRTATGPRSGHGGLDADLSAGLAEALEHGFAVDAEAGLSLRHELVSRAVAADLLPAARVRSHAAVATALASDPFIAMVHHLRAHDPAAAGRAAIVAADAASAVDAPGDELAALEVAISVGGALGTSAVALSLRAAEAAFAAGRTARAAAYLESTIAATDPREDRSQLALIHDRLGQFRRVAGDAGGALTARRRAVELLPTGVSAARAKVMAGLAQVLMLEGTFSEAERLAREAIAIAQASEPPARSVELHATTTLGVSLGWRDDPETAVAVLSDARGMAEELGDLDELFRVYANLTTVLDLAGRREDAVNVASEGIQAARAAGLEAVYGNFLRGNAADSLFLLGRWKEARALSMTALEWLPAGVNFLNTLVSLATVEIELSAGEGAGRLLGQTMLELEAVRDAQQAVPLHLAAASYALWRGDIADARRATDRGWSLARETEDWILAARTAATVVEVDAAAAVEARERRDLSALAAARERTQEVIRTAEAILRHHGVASTMGSRRLADAWMASARAFGRRVDGRDDASTWDAVGRLWASLGVPYETARAHWRGAEAHLNSGAGRAGRADARVPLLKAVRIALELGAQPLLRELRDLAARAIIPLPPEVDATLADPTDVRAPIGVMAVVSAQAEDMARGLAGPPDEPPRRDTFGLSSRESEVLVQIARGRTNREIGERLFISQKTVGVHVGNILAKLGVSGRVEAAAVAIRLDLMEKR